MAKLGCPCGHTIVDQQDDIPYKGYLLPDKLTDKMSDKLSDIIDGLAEAIKTGKKEEWMKTNFLVPPYPTDLKASSMVHDLFTNDLIHAKQDIYQCENCGRIAIEVGKSEHFKFFSPDDPDSKGILDPEK